MSLIVEDGNIIPDANSFISLVEARELALNYGIDLPVDDNEAEVKARQGYVWLSNTYEQSLKGVRVSKIQTGCFPRAEVYNVNDFDLDDDEIPNDIKLAQLYAMGCLNAGVDMNVIQSPNQLKSFNVDGVYSETYQDSQVMKALSSMPQVYNFLKPYTKGNGSINLYKEDYGSLSPHYCRGYN